MDVRCTAIVFLIALQLGVGSAAHAHGGGLDDRGCHRDASQGDYHCHQGPGAGQSFESKARYRATADQPTPSDSDTYNRDAYHTRWLDHDGDCMDTRDEVLAASSLVDPELGSDGCEVVAGRWRGPYTGKIFTDPVALDIDHVVPLAEAHESGAAEWRPERRHRYANDLEHEGALLAVEAGANRSKGSRDPAEWMPEREAFHCTYLEYWVEVKEVWDLRMNAVERRAVRRGLADCPADGANAAP